MIEIAQAKGWDLETLEINGSKAFKEEAKKQIAQILREKEQIQNSKNKRQEPTLLRPKTPLQYDLKTTQEQQASKQLPLIELKTMLAAKSVLAYAEKHYKLNPNKYEITPENKINNLHNKQKPKNVIDFLQKELNFSTKEAIEACQALYDAQSLVREINNYAHKLPTPVTLDIQKENTWQSITIEDYTTLAHTLKSQAYSQRKHQTPGILHPLLIYTMKADTQSNSLSIDAAKILLEKQNIPALLLSIQEDINTDENNQTKHYRIIIPVNTTQALTEKNQAHVHQEVAKQLGLYPYIDKEAKKEINNKDHTYAPHPISAVPHFTQVPQDTDVINIDRTIHEAILQKEKTQAILERAKKALKKSTQNPSPIQSTQDKTNLMSIDTQALNTLDVPNLVKVFEEIKEHTSLQDLSFLKTKEHKYLYESNNINYLYDIKGDKVLDVLGYLEQVLPSNDLEHTVTVLEDKLQRSFRTVNYEAIEEQFKKAIKESTSITELCTHMQKQFTVEVMLKEDILTLGNITLPLEKLGSNKEILTQEMTHNALKVAAKENQELVQENNPHKPKGTGFNRM